MTHNTSTTSNIAKLSSSQKVNDKLYSVPPNFDFETIPRTTQREAYQAFLKYYPINERWRLFVDGVKYAISSRASNEMGWVDYELREKMALAKCLYAFEYALKFMHTDKQVDNNTVKEIHRRLTKGLPGLYKPGWFKSVEISWTELDSEYDDSAGILDLIRKIESGLLPYAYIGIACDIIEASVSDKTLLLQILEILRDEQNPKQCILDRGNLNKLKETFINYYETFLSELVTYFISHKCNALYYSVCSQWLQRMKNIEIDLWTRLDMDPTYKQKIAQDLPDHFAAYQPSVFMLLVPKITKEMYEKITVYLRDVMNGINVELDQGLVDDLYKLVFDHSDIDSLKALYLKHCKITEADAIKAIKDDEKLTEAMRIRFSYFGVKQLLFFIAGSQVNLYIETIHEKVLRQYYSRTPEQTNEAVLHRIGIYIQAFQRIHAVVDGAGRTYVNILLNIFLLNHGFPPATFFEPNLFDAFSDVAGVIARGIDATLQIYASVKQKKEVILFGVKTQDIDDNIKQQIAATEAILASDPNNEAQKNKLANLTGLFMDDIIQAANDLCLADEAISATMVDANINTDTVQCPLTFFNQSEAIQAEANIVRGFRFSST